MAKLNIVPLAWLPGRPSDLASPMAGLVGALRLTIDQVEPGENPATGKKYIDGNPWITPLASQGSG